MYYETDMLVSHTRGMVYDVIQKRLADRKDRTYKVWINSFKEMKSGEKIAFAFFDIHDDTQLSTEGWMHYMHPIKYDDPIDPDKLIEFFVDCADDFEKPLAERKFRVPVYGYPDDEAPSEYAPR
jgi:hypothetical protein